MAAREGFSKVEKNGILPSQETLEGLRMTSMYKYIICPFMHALQMCNHSLPSAHSFIELHGGVCFQDPRCEGIFQQESLSGSAREVLWLPTAERGHK